jgi:hypothetical protein
VKNSEKIVITDPMALNSPCRISASDTPRPFRHQPT